MSASETNPFNENQRQTFRGLQIEFPVPTDNTFEMVRLCHDAAPGDLAGLRPRRTAVPVQTRYRHVVGPYSLPKRFSSTCFSHRPDIGQLHLQAAVDEVNGPLNLDSRLVVLGCGIDRAE